MLPFLVVLILGAAIGFLRGGSMAALRNARLLWMPFVVAALALQMLAQVLPPDMPGIAYGLVLVSYAAMFAWAVANRHASGMLFIALGALLNFIVIIANGGMPVSAEAAAQAGFVGEEAERLLQQGKHFIDAGDARFAILGDWIPLGKGGGIVSIGDLVLWAGLVLLLQDLIRGPRGRRTRIDPRDDESQHDAAGSAPLGHHLTDA